MFTRRLSLHEKNSSLFMSKNLRITYPFHTQAKPIISHITKPLILQKVNILMNGVQKSLYKILLFFSQLDNFITTRRHKTLGRFRLLENLISQWWSFVIVRIYQEGKFINSECYRLFSQLATVQAGKVSPSRGFICLCEDFSCEYLVIEIGT